MATAKYAGNYFTAIKLKVYNRKYLEVIMKKRLIVVIILVITICISGCQMRTSNDNMADNSDFNDSNNIDSQASDTSQSSSSTASIPNSASKNHNVISSGIEASENDKDEPIDEVIYSQALEKWKQLGGSFAFKSIEDIDTNTLVSIYTSYELYNSNIDTELPEIWLEEEGFDSFIKEYFNLSPEKFHSGNRYDSSKGFKFDSRASIIHENESSYQMTSFGNDSGTTYFFEALMKFELPKELVGEGETEQERKIRVSFLFEEGQIYFVDAYYEQNGNVL